MPTRREAFLILLTSVLMLPFVFSNSALGATVSISETGTAREPKIASVADNIYVVWSDAVSGNGDIYIAISDNGGATFSAPQLLSIDSPLASSTPQIATAGNNVYVAWMDLSPGNQEIFFRASHDNGRTFTDQRNLSTHPGSSTDPQLSSSGDNVYVVWHDSRSGNGDIYLSTSHNGGSTFSNSPFLISSGDNSFISDSPQIASVGSSVFVSWADFHGDPFGTGIILIRKSSDTGSTFGNILQIDEIQAASGLSSKLIADGQNVYLLWSDTSIGEPPVRLRVSHDAGNTFGVETSLSRFGGEQPRYCFIRSVSLCIME